MKESTILPFLGLIISDIDHLLQIPILDQDKVNLHVYQTLVKIINQYDSYFTSNIYQDSKQQETIMDFINSVSIVDETLIHNISCEIYKVKSNIFSSTENNFQTSKELFKSKSLSALSKLFVSY